MVTGVTLNRHPLNLGYDSSCTRAVDPARLPSRQALEATSRKAERAEHWARLLAKQAEAGWASS
jgi:hypothetical protein